MNFFGSLFKSLSAPTAIILAAAILLWSVPAAAAGFFLPTRGVESTARGGASIAPGDATPDTIWHNPAGLTVLDDHELSVDLAMVHASVEHQRAPRQMDDGSTRSYDPVQNQALPNFIPSITAGGPTHIDDVHWGAGLYTHYAFGSRYPEDGPQRYVLIDNVGSSLAYLHAAVGIELSDDVSVGVGIQNFVGNFRLVSAGSGYTGMFGDPEDEDLDILAEANVTSFFSPSANFGLSYQLSERVHTGVSVQLPHIFSDNEATIDTREPSHPSYDGAEITDNRVEVSVPFPFYVRAGARYAGDSFDIEAAVIYQHWSLLDEVVINPRDAQVSGAATIDDAYVQPLTIPQEFQNTFSAHLGGQYNLTESIDLRGGYTYERGAVPDHRYSLFALDPDKHQISGGLGYSYDDWVIDATGAAIIMPSKTITDSEVRQNNASDPDRDHSIVVANGSYEHFGFIVGLSTRYRF